jgi:hypothetical protein
MFAVSLWKKQMNYGDKFLYYHIWKTPYTGLTL